MSYVDDQLLPGERVLYRAHLHKLIYLWPGLFAAATTALALWAFSAGNVWAGLLSIGVAFVPALVAHIKYTSSEFAVTDKRVIIKVGWIRRRTLETMLAKVEGIGVEQGFAARMLGFGTITVTGTGGTKEPFANIARPLEFRRQVQAQVSAQDGVRFVHAAAASSIGASDGAKRDERDCPFCAERILARAKVCKHCGRDVQPLMSS